MNSNKKTFFTNIGKNQVFNEMIEAIAYNRNLSFEMQSLMLSTAILFNEEYNNSRKPEISDLEFSYYLILKLATMTKNYKPLYQFSINNGLYPIAKSLYQQEMVDDTFEGYLLDKEMDKFLYDNKIEIFNQRKNRENIINSNKKYISYVAPTSFGKSTLVLEDIKDKILRYDKIGIIVPKKSLISQYYRELKKLHQYSHKVIMHDKNYSNERKVIGILTQERALRLIENNDFAFDILYIDEAHNIFEHDDRNVLLARLIRQNKNKNSNQRIVYLSPLINDNSGLSLDKNIPQEFRIDFNIKDYDIYYFNGKTKSFYSRYFNALYELDNKGIEVCDYIKENSKGKNLVYKYAPRDVENFAMELSTYMEDVNSDEIDDLCSILSSSVDASFYNISCIRKGIIYIHGKLPDNIKEYLEYKYNTMNEIKYLVANSVILEGVNLPIESVFIVDSYKLNAQDLFNLIGRANRLNYVFSKNGFDVSKLIVPIHFIDKINKKTAFNKLGLLRDTRFKNNIENPILDNTTKPNDKIKKIEDRLLELEKDENSSVEKVILSSGLYTIYQDPDKSIPRIVTNMDVYNNENNSYSDVVEKVMDAINKIFFGNFSPDEIVNKDVLRLTNDNVLRYYKNYLNSAYHKGLQYKVSYLYRLFQNAKIKDKWMFIGPSYGELSINNGRKAYIRPASKDDKYLRNLAIVLAKIEDDYISFNIERFADALYRLKVITEEEYNEFLYGTKVENEMDLIKLGLSSTLINYLKDNNALDGITITGNGLYKCSNETREVIERANDLIKFEFNKYFE